MHTHKIGEKKKRKYNGKSCDVMTLRCLRPPHSLFHSFYFLVSSSSIEVYQVFLLVLFRGHQHARSGGGWYTFIYFCKYE